METRKREIHDLRQEDLEKEVLGKKVVHINETLGTIELNDGTTLQLQDTSSCCAYFDGQLKAGNFTDNAITAVSHEDLSDKRDYEEHWALHILAGDDRIASIDIDGTSTSGYYCHSINLDVIIPKENA
ncbi:MAG: DUF7448 domain-containing protein [Brevibacterium aurantiacum]